MSTLPTSPSNPTARKSSEKRLDDLAFAVVLTALFTPFLAMVGDIAGSAGAACASGPAVATQTPAPSTTIRGRPTNG